MHGAQGPGVQIADASGALGARDHEAGRAEQPEVLRDGRAAGSKIRCDLSDGLPAAAQEGEDLTPGRIGYGPEDGIALLVSNGNHTVTLMVTERLRSVKNGALLRTRNEECSYREMRPYIAAGTLLLALCLRLAGIAWGLPPVTAQVRQSDLRCSYAFDEDDALSGVAKADVRRLDFDPHEYHWGTLHLELVLLALDAAQAAGFFGSPWRAAYYNLLPADFTRVYVLARLVAVAAALLTIWLLFRFPGWEPGAFAAMLVAVSPTHLLQSDQVRVDVTMTALLVLTMLIAARILADDGAVRSRDFIILGLAAGLAVAAKYSAITAAAAIVAAVLWFERFRWRAVLASCASAAAGFVIGSPYILIKQEAFYAQVRSTMDANAHVPAEFLIPPLKLAGLHVANLARFSMGLPALLLAIAGLVWMLRRRSRFDITVLAAIAAYAAILIPLRWPMIRYDLPLIVLLGWCAGMALEYFTPPWRYAVAGIALLVPLAGSIAQIHYMRSPQPANLMLQKILDVVPPGNAIARLTVEEPPLDRKVYPMTSNVLTAQLVADRPAWVLLTDLTDYAYPPRTLAVLHSAYDEVARFESPRIFAWATLGEAGAPQDWKYTHADFVLYRKRGE